MAILVISYFDYNTFTEKKKLYSQSLRIEKLITKYEAIQNETNKIRAKLEILKQKKNDNRELKEIIQKSEAFLTHADGAKAKNIELINEYNQISDRYNSLPNQKLLFKNKLPEVIKNKTQPRH
jgi:hypothetical protein